MLCLQFISGRGPTGAAAAAIADVRALNAAGAKVCVACRKDAPAIVAALREAGLTDSDIFADFEFARGARSVVGTMRDSRRLKALCSKIKPDVIHVHRAAEHIIAFCVLGRACRARIVRTCHRSKALAQGPLLKVLIGQTAGFVCVSRAHERILKQSGAQHAQFIEGAIDTEFFAPNPSRTNSPVIIGQVGRWKFESGVDRGQRFALEVFSKLPGKLNWRGILAGRGEQEGELRRVALEQFRLKERVEVLSTQSLSANEYAALMGRFGLGMAFAVGSDGTSRPALEMLSCGVPLMVAAREGLMELAEDGKCGCIGPEPLNAQKWADEIAKLLGDPKRLISMQEAARRRALQAHAFKARGVRLLDFYRECTG